MKAFLTIAAGLFVLVLALPAIHSLTGWPPELPLQGAENEVPAPALRAAAWWRGTLQPDLDAWLNRHIGLRGRWVRAANQINYSLFRELPRGDGTKVVLGRGGFLFEKVYVDTYRQAGQSPEAKLREASAAVRRLQDRLAADGIAFLLVIAPSKAEIYPEFLPEEADAAGRPLRRSNYENMIGFLRQDGVNLVDAHQLFLEWKREEGAPQLFAHTGTHWNYYGAARVVEQILCRLRDLTGKDLPALAVVGSETNRNVVGPDNDLGDLANLWTREQLVGPQIHPLREKVPGTYRPDILFICDSFGTQLTQLMARSKLYRQQDTYFYNKRHFYWPRPRASHLDPDAPDPGLLAELQGRDAVVIVEVEYFLPGIGFGFVEELLRAYDERDAAQAAGTAP